MNFNENSEGPLQSDPPRTGADSMLPALNIDAEPLSEFKAADFVVHPAHGAGQLLSIEEQTVSGAKLECFVVYFAKSKMTLRVPVRKAAAVGMRKLSDKAAVEAAKQTLCGNPRRSRGNWPRLAQDYQSKINSGDIVAVAEVARDLFQQANSEQSFSERQLYVTALERLCGEIALVDGISADQSVKELENVLMTNRLRRSA